MLTADVIRPFLRYAGRTLAVDLLDEQSPLWLQTAEELVQLFAQHVGHPRSVWEKALEDFEGTRTDYLRIRGLAKVLTDAATFTPKPVPLPPLEMRRRLFPRGPAFEVPDMFHPDTRGEILQAVAAEVGLSAEALDSSLYADLPQAYLLSNAGPAWSPQGLLARYNLELSRGALYRASVVQLDVYDHFKEVWRYLKLFRIMFVAEALPAGGYRILLSGPLSDFVETERYGFAFAEFFPAILLAERWQLVAKVRPSPCRSSASSSGARETQRSVWGGDMAPLVYYRLDHTCGLRSHYRRGRLYDSGLERTFAAEFTDFEEKFGEGRGRWRLTREEQVLVLDGTVMIPDFVLTHEADEQRKILVELVGFWTPRYLQTKIAKAKAARMPNLLLLVYEDLKVTKEDFAEVEGDLLFFKQKPVLKEVMAAVEALADRVFGPLTPRRRSTETPPLPLAHLVQACREHLSEAQQERSSLKRLGALLRQSDPTFSPQRYGYRNLVCLAKENPDLFEVLSRPTKSSPLEVRLVTHEQHTPEEPASPSS